MCVREASTRKKHFSLIKHLQRRNSHSKPPLDGSANKIASVFRYQKELPKKIKQRGRDAHLIHEELVQCMKWKQSVSMKVEKRIESERDGLRGVISESGLYSGGKLRGNGKKRR